MNLLKWVGTGLLAVAPMTAVAGIDNTVDVFYAYAGVDDGVQDDDGHGYGIRGTFAVADRLFVGAEYQAIASEVDFDQVRAGVGINTEPREQVVFYGLAEFINFDYKSSTDSGFGIHAGTLIDVSEKRSFLLNARVGYVSVGDNDGFEGSVGGVYQFTEQFGAMFDYRVTYLQNSGIDFDVDAFRLGVRYSF